VSFGFAIESLVAILLLLTILYCVRLNKQLQLLKSDEQSLKATIAELVTATEIAERAIAGLKTAAQECDQSLGTRLQRAEVVSNDLERQIPIGEDLLQRIARVAHAGKNLPELPQMAQAKAPPAPAQAPVRVPPPPSDARRVSAAAAAFAQRVRERVSGKAA
jgi:hypothetical protein